MDFNPFAYEIEYSPELEPQAEPPCAAPSIVNRRPTSPKRKRDDATQAHNTTPKRSSPLRQVSTPSIDTIDMTTAADGVVDSDRTPTKSAPIPITPSKGLGDLHITTPQKSRVQHKPVSVEDPFRAAPSSSATAEPPLVRPTLISFTTPSKNPVIDVDSYDTPTTIRTERSASGLDTSKTPFYYPQSTTTKTATSPLATPSKPTAKPAQPLLVTLQKPATSLQSNPPIASKYVPSYVSPTSSVKIKDPKQFSIKPPFWKRWAPSRYRRFADHLRKTFDPVPFAEQEEITVEEVQHLHTALVVEPLHDETEKMGAVAEQRVEQYFKTYAIRGSESRKWASFDGKESVGGEMVGVRPGIVQIIGDQGNYIEVRFKSLSEEDQAYVKNLVSAEELMKLMREV